MTICTWWIFYVFKLLRELLVFIELFIKLSPLVSRMNSLNLPKISQSSAQWQRYLQWETKKWRFVFYFIRIVCVFIYTFSHNLEQNQIDDKDAKSCKTNDPTQSSGIHKCVHTRFDGRTCVLEAVCVRHNARMKYLCCGDQLICVYCKNRKHKNHDDQQSIAGWNFIYTFLFSASNHYLYYLIRWEWCDVTKSFTSARSTQGGK